MARDLRFTFVFLLVFLMCIINAWYHAAIRVSEVHASGWRHCVVHEVIGSPAGDLEDYQVRIVVKYGEGVSKGEVFYCNYQCKPDFSDIRFIASGGTMFLPYWAESIVYGDHAVFWVKIPFIPRYPGKTTIFVLYGNPEAEYEGGIKDTFIDADDFTSNTLDEYLSIGASWVIDTSEGVLRSITSNIDGGYLIRLLPGIERNVAIRTKIYVNNSDVAVGFLSSKPTAISEFELIGYSANYHPLDALWSSLRIYGGSGWWSTRASLPLIDPGWHIIEVVITPTHILVYRDNTLDAIVEDTTHNVLNGIGLRQHSNNSLAVDWWILRKFVDPEPMHGEWFDLSVFPVQSVSINVITITREINMPRIVETTRTRTITRTITSTLSVTIFTTVTKETSITKTITATLSAAKGAETTHIRFLFLVSGSIIIIISIVLYSMRKR